jgi:hypothetical protein
MESACLRVPSGRASRRVPTSRSRRSQAPPHSPGPRPSAATPSTRWGRPSEALRGSPERARCVGATSATRGDTRDRRPKPAARACACQEQRRSGGPRSCPRGKQQQGADCWYPCRGELLASVVGWRARCCIRRRRGLRSRPGEAPALRLRSGSRGGRIGVRRAERGLLAEPARRRRGAAAAGRRNRARGRARADRPRRDRSRARDRG